MLSRPDDVYVHDLYLFAVLEWGVFWGVVTKGDTDRLGKDTLMLYFSGLPSNNAQQPTVQISIIHKYFLNFANENFYWRGNTSQPL